MKTIEELKDILSNQKNMLQKQYKVKTLGIFGSYVNGNQNEKSDLDILVEFEKPIGLIAFNLLADNLSELLGVKVDLVMKSGLKPRISKHILNEVVYV